MLAMTHPLAASLVQTDRAVQTIGLLGGMSWESSIVYELIINREVRARLGGAHSASLLIRSYDFAQIERFQAAGGWDEAGRLLAADAARGADSGAGHQHHAPGV